MKRGSRPQYTVCPFDLPLHAYLLHREQVLIYQIAAIKGAIRAAEQELENTTQAQYALQSAK
jgi:hypothetical protein